MSHDNAANATPHQWPSGFVYVPDFLDEVEQQRVMTIIEENGFDQHVHRRQQFFGPTYYHTPQSYRAALQPVDESLPTAVLGQQDELSPHDHIDTISQNPQDESQSLAQSVPSHIGAKNMRHDIGQFQWLIDKLISHGLFERADVRDPFVEYINNGQNALQRVERHSIDPSTSPLFEIELQKLQHTLEFERNGENILWGQDTPYPDQILVNEYTVNQNIGCHFDDALCFGPLIVGVSCGSDCTLILSRPQCIGDADKVLRLINQKNDEKNQKFDQINEKCERNNHYDDLCETTTQKMQQNNANIISDIEDLDKEYIKCHEYDYYVHNPSKNTQNDANSTTDPNMVNMATNNELSYPISLRDFTKPQWREGKGNPILSKYCRCTRERLLAEKHPFGRILLSIKRQQEMNVLKQYPQVMPFMANQIYNTDAFYSEYISKTGENGQDITDKSASNTSKSEPSTISKNNNQRKKPLNIDSLIKHLEWLQQRRDKLGINDITMCDPTQYPQHVQEIIQLILSTNQFPTTEADMNAFIMSYDFDEFLLHYYNTIASPEITEKPISTAETRAQLIELLTPNLVDINTCTNTDDTLYIPVKRGSVYVLAGAARYQYRHAIKKLSRSEQKLNPDYRRVSLTVRSLMPGRRQVKAESEFDHDLSQYNYTQAILPQSELDEPTQNTPE